MEEEVEEESNQDLPKTIYYWLVYLFWNMATRYEWHNDKNRNDTGVRSPAQNSSAPTK